MPGEVGFLRRKQRDERGLVVERLVSGRCTQKRWNQKRPETVPMSAIPEEPKGWELPG